LAENINKLAHKQVLGAIVSVTSLLNITGLFMSTLAAGLMYYFPPRVQLFTDKGEPHFNWVGNPTSDGAFRGEWQSRLAKAGPRLLFIGFAMQLAGAIIGPG